MTTHLRRLLILSVLVFTGASYAHAATGYTTFTSTLYTSIQAALSPQYVNAIASDAFYNSYFRSGTPACPYGTGNCGYPTSCLTGNGCGGNNGKGDFYNRVDSEHPFTSDDSFFVNGYPGQLIGSTAGYGAPTALRTCQVFNQVDAATYGVPVDASLGAGQWSSSSDPGDDGGTRNTLVFTGTGWDLLEADHHYSLLGGSDARYYLTGITCVSPSLPYQALTVSRSSIPQGGSALLSWVDNDIYGAAAQSCSVSSAPSDPSFKLPPPILPVVACEFGPPNNLTKSGDPNQTSPLMSTHQDGSSRPYEYQCLDDTEFGDQANGCTTESNTCLRYDAEHQCTSWDNRYLCSVPPSAGSVTVSPAQTTTYTYSCTNSNGTTNRTATLTVTGAAPTVTCSASPSSQATGQPVMWTATPSGGTPPYATYSWTDNPAGNSSGNLSTNTWTVSGGYASAGTETATVKVTDAKGVQGSGSCSVPISATALPDLTAGAVTPPTAGTGSQTYSATVSNIGGASTGTGNAGTFFNFPQVALGAGCDANSSNCVGIQDLPNTGKIGPLAAKGAVGNSAAVNFNYATTTTGTMYLRLCADKKNSGDAGRITESDESNNCGAWTAIAVQNTLAVSCSVNPTQGDTSTTFTWDAAPSGGSGSYTYQWTGAGSLYGATFKDVPVTYSENGSYTGAVEVKDSAGDDTGQVPCIDQANVQSGPSVSCSFTPSSYCDGQNPCLVPSGGHVVKYTVTPHGSPLPGTPYSWNPSDSSQCTATTASTITCPFNNSPVNGGTYTMSVAGTWGSNNSTAPGSCPAVDVGTLTGFCSGADSGVTFYASPNRVAKGSPSELYYSIGNTTATDCYINGPGIANKDIKVAACGVAPNSIPTQNITSQSIYTFTCNASPAPQAVVNLLPWFLEF